MSRIVVGFTVDAARQNIISILEQNGFHLTASCKTGAEIIRTIKQMNGGLIICGWKFNDMMVDELAEHLEGTQAQILVIAKPMYLNLCEYKDLYRLPAPVHSMQLVTVVDMLNQIDKRHERAEKKRSEEDNATIQRAKERIMKEFLLQEPEAYRFLQKRSMDQSKSMLEVAKEVLKEDF